MNAQVKVGLVVIAAILLFYLGLAWVNGSGFWEKERHSYFIQFEDVDGLMEGDPVDVRGYVSGRVQRIIPGAGAIWVKISLDKELQLYQGTSAEIRVKEVLGGKQIAILPQAQGALLQAGDTLTGRSSLDFSSAFSTVGKVVEGIDGDLIRAFMERFDTLSVQFGRLANAIEPAKVAQITDNLLLTTQELRSSLSGLNSRDMIGRLDHALEQFSILAQHADASLEKISGLTDQLGKNTLPKADSTLERIYALLDYTDDILSSATSLLTDVENPETALGYLLNDPDAGALLDSTLHNLNRTLDHLRRKKIHVAMGLNHRNRTFKE